MGAGPLWSFIGGFSVIVVGLFIAFVFALDSAIGGAVGSLFSSAGDAPTR